MTKKQWAIRGGALSFRSMTRTHLTPLRDPQCSPTLAKYVRLVARYASDVHVRTPPKILFRMEHG